MIKNNKDKEERPTPESIERQITAARDVVQYCMNKTECRRVQLLHFFDEKFDKDLCKENCDNCADDRSTVTENITDTAKNAIALLRDLTGNSENVTLNQLQSILSGANTSDIREKGHDKQPLYGSAKDKPRELLEQTLKYLLYLDILATYSLQNNAGYHNEYAMVRNVVLFFAYTTTFCSSLAPKLFLILKQINYWSWNGDHHKKVENQHGIIKPIRILPHSRVKNERSLRKIPSNYMMMMTFHPTSLLS